MKGWSSRIFRLSAPASPFIHRKSLQEKTENITTTAYLASSSTTAISVAAYNGSSASGSSHYAAPVGYNYAVAQAHGPGNEESATKLGLALVLLLATFFVMGLLSVCLRRRAVLNRDRAASMARAERGEAVASSTATMAQQLQGGMDVRSIEKLMPAARYGAVVKMLQEAKDRNDVEVMMSVKLWSSVEQLTASHDIVGRCKSWEDIKNCDELKQQCSKIGEDDECAVCLSMMGEEEMVRVLPACRHCFHAPCIDTWLVSHSTCPVCRSSARSPRHEHLTLHLLLLRAANFHPTSS